MHTAMRRDVEQWLDWDTRWPDERRVHAWRDRCTDDMRDGMPVGHPPVGRAVNHIQRQVPQGVACKYHQNRKLRGTLTSLILLGVKLYHKMFYIDHERLPNID